MDETALALYKKAVESIEAAFRMAETGPVTESNILSPEELRDCNFDADLANPQYAASAQCSLIRHRRAVAQFGPV